MRGHNTLLTSAILSATFLGTEVSLAQTPLEEIVVTATKRDASLEDLAAAANVIGGDTVGPGGPTICLHVFPRGFEVGFVDNGLHQGLWKQAQGWLLGPRRNGTSRSGQ